MSSNLPFVLFWDCCRGYAGFCTFLEVEEGTQVFAPFLELAHGMQVFALFLELAEGVQVSVLDPDPNKMMHSRTHSPPGSRYPKAYKIYAFVFTIFVNIATFLSKLDQNPFWIHFGPKVLCRKI